MMLVAPCTVCETCSTSVLAKCKRTFTISGLPHRVDLAALNPGTPADRRTSGAQPRRLRRRFRGVAMHFIRIEDTADRATIEAAMVQLTEKAKRACIASTLREIRQDQDELVGMWMRAPA